MAKRDKIDGVQTTFKTEAAAETTPGALGDTPHPFKIECIENGLMNTHDLVIQVGNFGSEDDAKAFGKHVAEFLAGSEGWWRTGRVN